MAPWLTKPEPECSHLVCREHCNRHPKQCCSPYSLSWVLTVLHDELNCTWVAHHKQSFSLPVELCSSLLFNPLPYFMKNKKKQILTLETSVPDNLSWPCHLFLYSYYQSSTSAYFGPLSGHLSWASAGSTLSGNVFFSTHRRCSWMRYQMSGFHLDIIYLLYQNFILKKVHQCENWRGNLFWLMDNLEIIKVKASGSKGSSFMLLK